jgi:predicted metal-dependent enzyme (double-stranded beta helix superfamily)
MTPVLEDLVAAVEAALADPTLSTDRARAEAMAPAMARLIALDAPIPAWAEEPYEGGAVGNLVHADAEGRFHVLVVVFPEGTSSGVHFHGCWGVIGYLRGGDEETRYAEADGVPVEVERRAWQEGDIAYLLPDEGEGWHRVRNPGPGTGVSVHVLCRTPAMHPHQYWDRSSSRILEFPFVEVAPDRWVARVEGLDG